MAFHAVTPPAHSASGSKSSANFARFCPAVFEVNRNTRYTAAAHTTKGSSRALSSWHSQAAARAAPAAI